MDKVNELVREQVGSIVLTESQDPRFTSVTVTGAKVSADLHHARVFVCIHGNELERENVLAALNKAAGFVQRKLGQQIRLKYTPQLKFIYDETLDHADHIFQILKDADLGEGGESLEETE